MYICMKIKTCVTGVNSCGTSPRDMWAYLNHLAILLEDIEISFRTILNKEHEHVRKGYSTHRRTSSIGHVGERLARSSSKRIVNVTSDSGELNPCVCVCVCMCWRNGGGSGSSIYLYSKVCQCHWPIDQASINLGRASFSTYIIHGNLYQLNLEDIFVHLSFHQM